MNTLNKLKNYLLFLNNKNFVSLEKKVLSLLTNFPKLPSTAIDFIVNFGPYLILIGGILSILSIFSLFSFSSILFSSFSPFIFPLSRFFYISIIGSIISGILLILAFNDLQNLKIFGWRLVFWATNISIITAVFSLNFIGGIIGALICWYFLSQIYSKYH